MTILRYSGTDQEQLHLKRRKGITQQIFETINQSINRPKEPDFLTSSRDQHHEIIAFRHLLLQSVEMIDQDVGVHQKVLLGRNFLARRFMTVRCGSVEFQLRAGLVAPQPLIHQPPWLHVVTHRLVRRRWISILHASAIVPGIGRSSSRLKTTENQSINQSNNQPNNQSIDKSIKRINQSNNKFPNGQSFDKSTRRMTNWAIYRKKWWKVIRKNYPFAPFVGQ